MSLYGQGYAAGYGQEAYYRPGAGGAAGWGQGVAQEGEEEEDFEAEEEDEESADDSSDSDYAGGRKKKGKPKQAGGSSSRRAGRASLTKPRAGRAAGTSRAAAAAAPKKRTRKRAAYADEDDEDSALEDTSDSGADSEPAGYGAGGNRRGHGAAAAAAVARRPRRQAAARANANIKHTYEEPDEFEEADGAAANAFDEHAAAAAAPVPAAQFAQYYASHPEPYTQQQQQTQDEWQYPGAAQNGGSWQHAHQHAGGSTLDGQAWGAAGGYGYGAQAVQQDFRQGSQEQQQRQQQETWQDHYQQQEQQPQRNHQQQPWQRSQEPPSPQSQQLALSQQQQQQPYAAAPSPAPRRTSAPFTASRTASNRPSARGSGSGRSASAAAATPSRRPSRAAAAARSSYYEGSGDSEAEDEEDEEAGAAFLDDDASSSGGEGGSGDGEYVSGDEGGSDGGDDYQYALQMQEELNGMRARRTRQQGQGSRRNTSAIVGQKRGGASLAAAGGSQKRRRARATVTKISYAESGDSSDDSEARAAAAAARREPVPALEDTGDGWEAEGLEEVERVLGHRAAAANGDAAPEPGADPWPHVEFHVKWRRLSFIHTSWQPLEALRDLPGFKRVLNYMKRIDAAAANRSNLTREELELIDVSAEMEQQLLQQYTQVERVIAERPGQSRSLLVKWEGLPYCEATWEAAEDVMAAQGGPEARDEFLTRQQRMQETARGADAARNAVGKAAGGAFQELQEQPAFLTAGQLRKYQLEGLNWLTYAWLKGNNTILADEMGLGKTVQCVSLVGLLAQHMSVRGPFLVVVPLSTVPNWIKEFRKWVPMVNAVVYVGDGRSRDVIRAFEFPGAPSNRSRPYGFEALITTYELVLKDAALLRQIPWQYLLVDEAHRLKNSDSALYQELSGWSFQNKLLVTGTPLQNSMRELWCLLNFLEPGRFGAAEEFEAAYKVEGAAVTSLSSLHSSLKPHLLRRVIKDVETSLPPKTERILRVEMTPLQRQYYKWILSRNFKQLNKGARGQVSLLNIIIELKKACNHPFLFESAEDEYRLSDEHTSAVDRLVVTSGKMVLLDKLMRRLRETGHRVLVFSQMVRVLDIISDYLRLRGYPHQRLDGSTPAAARHAAMEAFNRPDSPDFAFLLSTRAGGLGINLATADTVIIFDSDWNPQNDLQAMSRAHRIGQTEAVNIYRFVTSGSVEQEILERAKRKMVLDHLVIQRMDTSGRTVLGPAADSKGSKMFGKDELAAILRFGAEDLFAAAEVGSAERSRRLLEEDIDDILMRAEVVSQQPGQPGQSVAGGASDLLSSFNVATFKNEEDDATFWSRLISEPDRPQEELNAPLGPRAARTKQQQQQQQAEGAPKSASRSPPGSRQPSVQQPGDESPPGGAGGSSRPKPKKARRPGGGGGSSRGSDKPGAPVEGAVLRIDAWPLEPPAQDGKVSSNTRSLGKRDAVAFVRAVRRYGLRSRLADVASEAGGAVEAAGRQAQELLWEELVQGCRQALERAAEQDKQQGTLHDPREVTLDFFGCAVKASEFSQHLAAMELLSTQVKGLQSRGQDPCVAFRLEAAAVPPAAKWGKALGWTPRDDAALLLGVYFHGFGHMEELVADTRLGLQAKLGSVLSAAGGSTSTAAAAQGRGEEPGGGDKAHAGPKASHLETRVLGILRKMLAISGQPTRTNSRRGHKAQKGAAGAGAAPAAAGGAAAAGAAGTAGGAAERKAAKKAAAKRAAALAAAGITAVRNTPTPPPPPVHLQAAGSRQLGLAQCKPLPTQQTGKPPVGGPAAAARMGAAGVQRKQQVTTQAAAAGAAGGVHMQHSSSQSEGSAARAQPAAAEAAHEQPAAAAAAPAQTGAPPPPRAVSPFAGPAAAGAGSGLPVPPPSPPPPPPPPSSPPPKQQQQRQQPQQQQLEEVRAVPPPPPPPLAVDGASPAGAADGPRSTAGQPDSPVVPPPPPPPPPPEVPAGNPSSPGAQPPTEQQLQAMLAGVSTEMRGLLQLNTSAAAGEEQEDEHQVVRLTKAYLLAIGQAVQAAAAAHPALEQQLWAHVVSSVQTPMTQQKFASLCRKLVAKSTAPAAAAAGSAPGSSSMTPAGQLSPSTAPAAAAAADGNHGRMKAGAGRAITPGNDLPCFHAEEQQPDASPMQQPQQQQQQQAGLLQEQGGHRDAHRLPEERGRVQAGSREPSRERHRGRASSSSRSRSRDREVRGSNRDQNVRGTGRGRRSSSGGRSRSSSRDRGRDRDSQRRAARSRSTERYGSRGYGQHRQYSSRRYRSRSRSRSREYRQPYSSSRYSRGRRSYSRSRSSSRGRSRSYDRGREDRRRSRSHSRRRRSYSYSRGRRRSYSRDRGRRQPRRRSDSRSSDSRSRSRG